jgi:hypothetical protein
MYILPSTRLFIWTHKLLEGFIIDQFFENSPFLIESESYVTLFATAATWLHYHAYSFKPF